MTTSETKGATGRRQRRPRDTMEFTGAADEISAAVLAVLASAHQVASTVVQLVSDRLLSGDEVTRADLERVHPMVESAIETHAGLLVGAGFVAAPDFLKDAALWVDWRLASESGYRSMEPIFDATDVSNYDYIHAEWFEAPRRGAAYAIVGPYVDFGGTNAYVITITVPVRLGDTFLGVAGADVAVDRVESILRRATRNSESAAAVINAEGRIVATSIPRQSPGSLLRDIAPDAGAARESHLRVLPMAGLPWRLLVLGCKDPRSCDRQCAACTMFV